MFRDLIDLGGSLANDIRSLDVSKGLRDAGKLLDKLADAYDFVRGLVPVTFATSPAAEEAELAHLEIVGADLAAVCRPTAAGTQAGEGESAGMDPATIALLFQLGLQAAKFVADLIRERRKKKLAPAG